MRFVSFQFEGQSRWGVIENDSIFDLSEQATSLKSAIAEAKHIATRAAGILKGVVAGLVVERNFVEVLCGITG